MAAAAQAFRRDPARDAGVDATARRWLPPGFLPQGDSGPADPRPTHAPAPDTRRSATRTEALDPAPVDTEEPAATQATDANPLPAFLTT